MKIRYKLLLFLLALIIVSVSAHSQYVKSLSTESSKEVPHEEKIVEVEESVEKLYTEEEIIVLSQTLYGECRGIESTMEKAAVVWCILNRVDAGYGKDILSVVSAENQFIGYNPAHPVLDELYWISEDVLERWYLEKEGVSNVGRILPDSYLYFTGDGEHNWFREDFNSNIYWDWSLEDIYL